MTRISIITASLDQGRYIRRTIESVLSQGVASEYLVVDGGSSDETLAILMSYGDRLRWTSEPDRGQSHAINKGLLASSGDVIGWLNSDDVYLDGALAAVRSAFEAQPDADVIYGDARYVDEHERDLGPYPVAPFRPEHLRDECFIAQPALFLRRRVLDVAGLLDERLHYAMDYDYWLRLLAGGVRFRYLQRPLALCRMHASAKTVIGGLAQSRELFAVQKRHTGRVSENAIRKLARDLVESWRLDAGRRPVLHRLAATPLTYALALRYAPQSLRSLVRWHLGWPARFAARQRARAEARDAGSRPRALCDRTPTRAEPPRP